MPCKNRESMEHKQSTRDTLAPLNPTQLYHFEKDLNGTIVDCDEGIAELLDSESPQHVIGKKDFDFFPRNQAEHLINIDMNVAKGVLHYQNAIEILSINKIPFICLVTKKSIMKNNMPKGVFGTVIGEKKYCEINKKGEIKRLYIDDTQDIYLTEKELPVFRYAALGYSCEHIALVLNKHISTVNIQTANICKKLNCRKSELTKRAIELNLMLILLAYTENVKKR